MANYFIGIDDTGQPYIAHAMYNADAGTVGTGKQRGFKKYLQKVQDYYGKGKNLYLYTQDQVRAFANRGANKVKSKINYGKEQLHTASQRLKAKGSRLVAKTKDKLGYDERDRLMKAQIRYEQERDNYAHGSNRRNSSERAQQAHDRAYADADKQSREAIDDYLRTPLGWVASKKNGWARKGASARYLTGSVKKQK